MFDDIAQAFLNLLSSFEGAVNLVGPAIIGAVVLVGFFLLAGGITWYSINKKRQNMEQVSAKDIGASILSAIGISLIVLAGAALIVGLATTVGGWLEWGERAADSLVP